jgi:hypothetical protein
MPYIEAYHVESQDDQSFMTFIGSTASPHNDATHRLHREITGSVSLLGSCHSTKSNTSQDAVDLLNTLQTPFGVLKKRWDAGVHIDEVKNLELRTSLSQIGYSVKLLFHSSPDSC